MSVFDIRKEYIWMDSRMRKTTIKKKTKKIKIKMPTLRPH